MIMSEFRIGPHLAATSYLARHAGLEHFTPLFHHRVKMELYMNLRRNYKNSNCTNIYNL